MRLLAFGQNSIPQCRQWYVVRLRLQEHARQRPLPPGLTCTLDSTPQSAHRRSARGVRLTLQACEQNTLARPLPGFWTIPAPHVRQFKSKDILLRWFAAMTWTSDKVRAW